MKKNLLIGLSLSLLASCASNQWQTKSEAFPAMYDDRQPVTIVVVPAINNTTAAEASNYFNVTITEPVANQGYYPMPVEIVRDIFLKEGEVEKLYQKRIEYASKSRFDNLINSIEKYLETTFPDLKGTK